MSTSARELRRLIHAHPDLSGEEQATADTLIRHFRKLGFNNFVESLGGTGLAVRIDGKAPGPTVMLRAELDALPISEEGERAHRSTRPGVAHSCGHDGHMAILAEVGQRLASQKPQNGRVILIFQPAEETGKGALSMLDDPRFAAMRPDLVFALHNLPDEPLGTVLTREGIFSCASRGLHISLRGLETHAAQPEQGISPAPALARLMQSLAALGDGTGNKDSLSFATVVHASMGARSFGIAPGAAELMVTLRSDSDAAMQAMVDAAMGELEAVCSETKLTFSTRFDDVFPATANDPAAFKRIAAAADGQLRILPQPFRWSEDFGHFTERYPGAMFGLGAGSDTLALHHPAYDFPDALIDTGADIFMRLIDAELSS